MVSVYGSTVLHTNQDKKTTLTKPVKLALIHFNLKLMLMVMVYTAYDCND